MTPSLLYANKTTIGNFTIYHNAPLDNNFINLLDNDAEQGYRKRTNNYKADDEMVS
ncbi:MAG: hypothetical protein ABI840_12070 [bacterium]